MPEKPATKPVAHPPIPVGLGSQAALATIATLIAGIIVRWTQVGLDDPGTLAMIGGGVATALGLFFGRSSQANKAIQVFGSLYGGFQQAWPGTTNPPEPPPPPQAPVGFAPPTAMSEEADMGADVGDVGQDPSIVARGPDGEPL